VGDMRATRGPTLCRISLDLSESQRSFDRCNPILAQLGAGNARRQPLLRAGGSPRSIQGAPLFLADVGPASRRLPSCVRLPSLADGAVPSSAGRSSRFGGTPCRFRARAARDCSPSSFGAQPSTASEPVERFLPGATPSRTAVTAAAGRGAQSVGQATPRGLTVSAASHNLARSAGRGACPASSDLRIPTGAPRPADLRAVVAVSPSSLAAALGGGGRGSAGARSPVVISAPAREQSRRRLIRTTTTASSLAAHSPLPTYLPGWWAGGSGGDTHTPSLAATLSGAPA